MAEKEEIFSSKIKYKGIFNFKEFYNFCYNYVTEEVGIDVGEDKYTEKISGDAKDIESEWSGNKKMTDYFRFDIKISFEVEDLKNVEINQDGKKIKTNQGSVVVKVKGTLTRDYQGKFETNAFNKFLRSIYEKWVITSRISEYEDKIYGKCDEFMAQAKSYLDLEGKR